MLGTFCAGTFGAEDFYTRVENSARPGTPDLWYVLSGGATGWIEAKVGELRPRRGTVAVDWPLHQQRFAQDCARAGLSRCLLLLGVGRVRYLVPATWVLPLDSVGCIEVTALETCGISWAGAVPGVEVRRVLTTPERAVQAPFQMIAGWK